MNEALMVRGIEAGYGGRTVLRGFTAEFPRASVTVILGPGGSGKSTLLRTIAGSTPEPWSSGEIPRVNAWLLPQATRTTGQLVFDAQIVSSARAEIDAWLSTRPTVLSAKLREALLSSASAVVRASRILAANAEVLLLDEPETQIDETVALALARLLRALAQTGKTIIVVTHNLALVDHLADHVILLVDGVKLDEGPLARVRALPASDRVRDFFTWGG